MLGIIEHPVTYFGEPASTRGGFYESEVDSDSEAESSSDSVESQSEERSATSTSKENTHEGVPISEYYKETFPDPKDPKVSDSFEGRGWIRGS